MTVGLTGGVAWAYGGHVGGWNGGFGQPGAFGTVTSVNGSSTAGTCGVAGAAGAFTLTGWRSASQYTVDVGASTTFVEPGVSSPSFADVCVGEMAGALGTVSSGTVSATSVFVAPVRSRPTLQGVFGTVTSVNGSSTAGTCGVAGTAGAFTVATWRNTTTYTIDVATTTTFLQRGASSPSFADVCVGDLAGATGTISGTTVAATQVGIAPVIPPQPQGAFGTVTSVNGSSATGTCGVPDSAGAFTLSGWQSTSTFTVDVTTATTFVEPGSSSASFANVCVGELAGATGTVVSGTVTATKVFVAPVVTPPTPHGIFGTVTSVNGSSTTGTCGVDGSAGAFTIATWHDSASYTVNVSTTTTFVEPGVSSPSFADVCVGSLVGALGSVSGDTVTAARVALAPVITPPSLPQGAFGSVQSVDGSSTSGTCGVAGATGSFVVSGFRNTTTVNVSASTTFVEPGVSSPTFANVCVGSLVGALGSVSGGMLTPTSVFIAP